MAQHRNKMNRKKQGRDKLFYVVTKVPTQNKEVLSLHNKLSLDITIKLNTEESCRYMKTGSR